jgi:hypothetical protein
MSIKWGALGEVAAVSAAVGIAIVVIFAVGVLAWSSAASESDRRNGGGRLPNVAAGLCFLACALIAAYGIYLIIPRFH